MLFTVFQYNRSLTTYNNALRSAAQNTLSFNQLIETVDKAITIVPQKSAYSVTKINWLLQGYEQNKDQALLDSALATLERVERYEKYDRNLFVNKLSLLQQSNKPDQMLPVIEETLEKFPWDISFYERAMTSYGQARANAVSAQDEAKAKEMTDRIRAIEAEIQRRVKLLEELPEEQQQGRNFSITEPMQAVLATLD
jgi:tetratricopeptide (TPR) repeat protein